MTASSLAAVIASSTRADSPRSVASGFSISIGTPRSTAAMIGSTWRCSSVAMMAQVTSGRLSSSRRSWVTKSAPIFSATCCARLWFFSAMPIHLTAGWRAATSPRNSPTRPAPMMARPTSLADFLKLAPLEVDDRRDRLVGQRQVHRCTGLGREVGGAVGLHDHAGVLGRHHGGAIENAGLEKVDGLGSHLSGEHVIHLLARHGRHRELGVPLDRVEPVVAVGVVKDEGALGAGNLH